MAAAGDIEITLKARDRRLIERLITRLDVLITLLVGKELDAAQEQDSDVSGGAEPGD